MHVLCEKPIAASSAQAERMIAACERGGVKLMIAYRLHFEEANLSAMEIVRGGRIGEPRFFSAIFSQQVTPDNTRTQRVHAGGPLRDVGIYCINAARYLFRDEPTQAVALAATKAGDARFREIDEQVSALLRFPGERLAQLTCSFGAYGQSAFTVVGTQGILRLSPAFNMSDLVLEVEVDGKTKRRKFRKRDQVAPELDELAACIREDRDPEPSGREGLADLRVIEAIEASARHRGRIEVSRVFPERRPSISQARRRPARGRAERSTSGARANKKVPDRHPLAVGAKELDGVGAHLQPVLGPGPPLAIVADRHVVARHLGAIVGPDVLDEAGAVPGDVGVRVDLLAGGEGLAGARDGGQLAVDDPAADLQRRGGEGEPFARKGPGGHDELESGHGRGYCSCRAETPGARDRGAPPGTGSPAAASTV